MKTPPPPSPFSPAPGRAAPVAVAVPDVRARWRVPLKVWVILAVVGAHGLIFWVISDKQFLPKTRYVPPPPPVNFGSRQQTHVDPQTGEVTRETEFVISTQLATPTPAGSPK